MKKTIIIILLILVSLSCFAQQTITGIVKSNTGEPLIGANILIKETFKGTATNSKGEFKFTGLKQSKYTLRITYLGYAPLEIEVPDKYTQGIVITLEPANILSEEVIVTATRVKENDPASFTNINNTDIKENNFGQDIPYLLSSTPSMVSTSDAGTGIGYTYFRIRGTDLNRINITMNGIPLNDSESHGVWFVNMPDLLSSVDNIQIQRGVGTSTNGAASFGATLNLQTKTFSPDAYAEINSYGGSFNTFRTSVNFGTGLINNKFSIDGRLSKIVSDGYIDRAESDLKSFYLSGSLYTSNSILKANIISGVEKTYQAWYGVPKVRLEDDYEGMERYLDHGLIDQEEYEHMINSDNRTYNFYTYDNETDNYQQDHYQLFFAHQFSTNLHLNTALHYTRGRGYYEQYKKDRDLTDYQLEDIIINTDTITHTDLIQQKWLDNHFYGGVFSLDYHKGNLNLIFGGGWNQYLGGHFGEIIWARYSSNSNIRHRWYDNDGDKKDLNLYIKAKYVVFDQLTAYVDFQYRGINYSIDGIDDDLRNITQNHKFNFFNPKLGLFYQLNDANSAFFTFGVANREPNRSNYTDADPSKSFPVHETLYDFELGYNLKRLTAYFNSNIYYMYYNNQLVLTGEINDVGSAIMTNVGQSYRLGFELSGGIKLFRKLDINVNTTLSRNKIIDFTEYIDNWDSGDQMVDNLGKTDLSFSPEIVANSTISYKIIKNLKAEFISKYVGKQYIDNTSNNERSIDPYFVNDLKLSYTFKTKSIKEISIHLLCNNIFNHEYESNAWVYRYILGGEEYTQDGYFPQAGINFLGGINLKF